MVGVFRAGRSARRWSRRLAWEVNPIRRYGRHYLIIGGVLFGLTQTGADPALMGFVGFLFIAFATLLTRHALAQPEVKAQRLQVKNTKKGGKTERRFAFRLYFGFLPWRLLGQGPFVLLPDRGIPGSNANIDMLFVSRKGVFNIDPKDWVGLFEVTFGALFYGRNERYQKTGQRVDVGPTKFETGEIRKALSRKTFGGVKVPVRACWAVHQRTRLRIIETRYTDDHKGTAQVAHSEWTVDGIKIMDKRRVTRWVVIGGEKVLTRRQVKEVGRDLRNKFPVAK